jgi:CubicO group peptidase (beta-lactamase class C family)
MLAVAGALSWLLIPDVQPDMKVPSDAPAEKQLNHWLEVFARGDQDEFVRFIRERYGSNLLGQDTAVNLADRQARRYIDTLGLKIGAIEKSSATAIVALAQAQLTGLWYRLSMTVEHAPPHRITEYSAQRVRPPGTMKPIEHSGLVAEIQAFTAKLAAADAFSGALLVAKDGNVVFQVAYGQASKAYNAANRLDTRFNIASVGKTFTAVSILQLTESGKLSLTDTVGKFLPDYPNADVRDKVTIHHLLTHTGGLGDFHGPKYIVKQNALRRPADYLPLIQDTLPAFEPGARLQYSNAGYILLGLIIEKATGENYFDYVRTHIFEPAGMAGTGYFEADMDTPNLATGYTNFLDRGEDYHEFHLGVRRNTRFGIKGNPQGGAFCTAEDLLRFSIAFREGKLVSTQTVELMTTPKYFFRKYSTDDIWYGYGFELENIDGQRVIGHGGGDLGVSSGVRWYPDSGNYTVVVLSNYDRGGIIAIDKLQEMIVLGKPE